MMNKASITLILFCMLSLNMLAQSVSVAPSRIYYKVTPGASKAQILKITNSSSKKQSFQLSFGDFEPNGTEGKISTMKAGESAHSLSKYMSANPSFFELEAGQSKDVQILLELPNLPDASKVKWGTVIVKLVKEKTEATRMGSNDMGLGILETFQFVVHVFQTPPSVTNKQAEIVAMKAVPGTNNNEKAIVIQSKNTGDAIIDCASYIELVNTQNGKKERLKPIAFTLLPGLSRNVKFALPPTLEKGKYTVTGVVDYGSKDDVQAAELDLEL